MNIKNIMQIEMKSGEWVTHWNVDINTPIEILEKMAIESLQYFGKVKEEALQKQKEQQQSSEAQEEIKDQSL